MLHAAEGAVEALVDANDISRSTLQVLAGELDRTNRQRKDGNNMEKEIAIAMFVVCIIAIAHLEIGRICDAIRGKPEKK